MKDRSSAVHGPLSLAIVNTPTNVPSQVNPWVMSVVRRTCAGLRCVGLKPMNKTPVMTLRLFCIWMLMTPPQISTPE